MNKKKFMRLIITIFIACLLTLMGLQIYDKYNILESSSVYGLYNENIPEAEKTIATNGMKKLIKELQAFQVYSPDIKFDIMHKDSVLAGVAKKDYLEKLNNPANKKYINIMKKYLKFKIVHVYRMKPDKKNRKYGLCLEVKYLDLENNYKLYKNKQLLGTVDKNMEFFDYLNDSKNIELSQRYIDDYYMTYIYETNEYIFKAPDIITYYMFQIRNINQTIDDAIKSIVYDISNEPKEEEKEDLKKAKAILDKELEYIRSKDTEQLTDWLKANINTEISKKIKALEWIDGFKSKYARTQVVKFLFDTNKYEYIGYNNKKNTIVYAIKGYNYDELNKMFINTNFEAETNHMFNYNKFLMFEKAYKNNEYIPETRFVEVQVEKKGFTDPLLMHILPKEEYIWDYNEAEYKGLQGIEVKDIPKDYNKYFSVISVPNFANRAAVVYISKESYMDEFEETGSFDSFNNDCNKLIIDSLKIILDYEKNVGNTVYREDFDKLVSVILQKIKSQKRDTTINIDAKEQNLNGVAIRLNISGNSVAMTVRVDKWETE